jgi:hypothetical protein
MAKSSSEHANANGMSTCGPLNNGDAVVLKASISMSSPGRDSCSEMRTGCRSVRVKLCRLGEWHDGQRVRKHRRKGGSLDSRTRVQGVAATFHVGVL